MSGGFRIAIPARYGSTRFPGKPLAILNGRPMIEHVWRRARAAGADEVVIATDDARIRDTAAAFGARVCTTRADHTSGTDRLAEVVEAMEWADDDRVVNLQGDEPLTPPTVLAQVADDLACHTDVPMTTLATPMAASAAEQPHLVKVVTDYAGRALYFSRAPIPYWRDTMPGAADPPAYRHVGIYGYRAGFLRTYAALPPAPLERAEQLEQLRALWHGYAIRVAEAIEVPEAGVDVPDDVTRVEAALARFDGGRPDGG